MRRHPGTSSLALLAAIAGSLACPSPGSPDAGPASHPLDGELRLNHIQVKGTHNSYHLRPSEIVADPWDYDQPPLFEQLEEHGVRQLEIDVWYDAAREGFDVFHIATLDPNSSCPTLAACLDEVAAWSEDHPAHAPIFVLLEPKNAEAEENAGRHPALIAALERIVEESLGEARLLTPAAVKKDAPSLQDAVADPGWPLLGEVRGRVMVVLFDEGSLTTSYSHGDQHLDDRLLFVRGRTEHPFGVFVKHDDPLVEGAAEAIAADLARGFVVRTRADENGEEARRSDPTRLEAALASGSHMISTDFPGPTEHDYEVAIPGGQPAGCNPVTAPASCTPLAVEDPALVHRPEGGL